MEPVRIKCLTLNGVMLGKDMPFSVLEGRCVRVEKVFPFSMMMRFRFTPPYPQHWEIYGHLQGARERQLPVQLSVEMTGFLQPYTLDGYLIWVSAEGTSVEEAHPPFEIELEIAKPL